MIKLLTTLTVHALLYSIVCASDIEESVIVLGEGNFHDFIENNSKVLVEFYAPWCGHCKRLEPEYVNAATRIIADESNDVVLAKVDATEHVDLAHLFGVQSYPTLKYIMNGDISKPIDYKGGRTSDAIYEWAQQQMLPSIIPISNINEFDSFISKYNTSLIAFFNSENELLNNFATYNRELINVAQVTDETILESIDNNIEFGNLYFFKHFGEPEFIKYDGNNDIDDYIKFVNTEKFELIADVTQQNYISYIERGLPLVWISVNFENKDEKNQIYDALISYAEQFKGKLSFLFIDNIKYDKFVSHMGIKRNPGLLIIKLSEKNEEKYLFDNQLKADEKLKEFFNGYETGTLERYLISEDIPEQDTDSNVTVVVGKSYNDYIGGEKDVLLEFYSPNCGHCKNLEPEYEKVAGAFGDNENVIIAIIDATANDIPNEEITGFPTIKFYKSGSKEGIMYQGQRDAESIIEWVEEQKQEFEEIKEETINKEEIHESDTKQDL